ncbi:MAG: hypothetical protein EAX90_11515 [Candidatus Heimdallarchaeota archaeon]|nr:hypothetical protein [Candidatus Heimdallarchaeota archaeon]
MNNLHPDDFSRLEAPPAVEINIRQNILYTEEYSYLTRDELEVLFLLATTEMFAEGMTSFSFSGIKRQLGKHQQKITKAINRLVSKNLLQKNGDGYSLSSKGTIILSQVVNQQNAVDLHKSTENYLEQRILFDKKVSLEQIAALLIGKWFGSFRYISHTEGKQLIVRWQLVDSRASASMKIFPTEAVLNIMPDNNGNQIYSSDQAMEELSQYFLDLLISLEVEPTIDSQEWKNSSLSVIDYQQRLSSWLRTNNNKQLSEN